MVSLCFLRSYKRIGIIICKLYSTNGDFQIQILDSGIQAKHATTSIWSIFHTLSKTPNSITPSHFSKKDLLCVSLKPTGLPESCHTFQHDVIIYSLKIYLYVLIDWYDLFLNKFHDEINVVGKNRGKLLEHALWRNQKFQFQLCFEHLRKLFLLEYPHNYANFSSSRCDASCRHVNPNCWRGGAWEMHWIYSH